ncbi:MAG: TetR/AcrR family transcriptional regulator [Nevskia sp.]|nr:TetR/AcrR family transcriptional regulator [Nevskia sp.]
MSTTVVWPVARAQQKENRREAILVAAEALVRETGSTEFSVGTLAQRADLSVATLYNLIGSKGTILYALLNRTMDQLEAATAKSESDDPYEQALSAATAVARVYVQDSQYLRPLWRFELGVIEPEHRPALMNRALSFWASRLGSLERAGRLPEGIGLVDLAREYQIFFAGVLDLWVQNELSDAQFEVQVRYGILLRLLALGNQGEQARLMADLRKTHRRLHAMDAP